MLINGHGRNDRSCWYGSNRKRNRNEIEHLTFNEIVNIIDGQVLGGNKGITKMVSKFAMSNGTQRYFKVYWSKDIIDRRKSRRCAD